MLNCSTIFIRIWFITFEFYIAKMNGTTWAIMVTKSANECKRELLADKEVNLNTLTRTITEKGEYTVMFFMVSPTKKQHNSKRNNSPNRCDDCFHTFHRRACWSYTTNNVVSRNLRVTLKLPKWWIFSHPTHHQMTVLLTYNYVPFGATTTIFALYL